MRDRSAILASLGFWCIAVACASPGGIVWATGPGSRTSDGLQRVRWSDLGALFLKPGAPMQQYHRVLLEPLKIAPASADEEHRGFVPTPNYPPTPDYLERMQGIYRDSLAQELGRNGFELVAGPGPDVIQLSGYVIDLILTAPLDPQDQARNSSIVRSFGELTLVLDLRDAVSGTPLLRAIDRQQISSDPLRGAVTNSVAANLSAQRDLFDHQALLLRTRLQELQQQPAPPAP